MKKIHTHYDNLKVTRNAPLEVIRAAYKSLSLKYHPDRNPGNPDAARVMAIINNSYDILSDPQKRNEHDIWIAQQEEKEPPIPPPPKGPEPQQPIEVGKNGIFWRTVLRLALYSFCLYVIFLYLEDKPEKTTNYASYNPNPTSDIEEPPENIAPPEMQTYTKPLNAPNNEPWPIQADYVNGYPKLRNSGFSSVTIDNSQNDSDVFVKLVSLDTTEAFPVRHFYIPAFGKFTVNKVTKGSYDIRYRDLNTGALSRSESFDLVEIPTVNGTEYSMYTMTLYKVQNGNMQTFGLSESEF